MIPPSPARDNDWLTPDDMAAVLHVSRRQVLRLVRTHNVPVIRPARSVVLFDPIARHALEEACRSKSVADPTPGRLRSTAGSALPVRKLGSESASALAVMTQLLREKKPSRSNSTSSGDTSTATVHKFDPSR